MQGYDPRVDAADLVRRYGPEVAQQMIAAFMQDRGMGERNAGIWSGMDVRGAKRKMDAADLSDGMVGAPGFEVGDDADVAGSRGAGPYPGAGRPGYDRTYTTGEVLAQRADMESGASGGTPLAFTVPSPRMPYGREVRPGAPIYDEEQAAAYTQRPVDPRTMQASPSQRDLAMQARGMVPVYNPDGSIGYSVEAYPEDEPSTPQNEGLPFPGGVGRLGRRQDLLDAGWEARPVDGPTGKQTVYRPGATAQSRYDAQADARSRSRIKRSAGISSAEADGMTTDALRAKARDKRDDDYNARNERWKAQAMLAGGQPTGGRGGSKAVTNALMTLPEDERNQSLQYMLPGGDRAAAVDATNAATAGRMAQSAMSAFLTNSPMATPEQRAMFEQRAREANPAAAGSQDIAAGKPETPEAQAELRRIAESMDTGNFGVNAGDSSSMADALMKPPYNLRQPEAEELAYRYMNRRSWFGIGRPGAAGSTPPTGVGPTPNPVNPRVPLAAPSRPPGV